MNEKNENQPMYVQNVSIYENEFCQGKYAVYSVLLVEIRVCASGITTAMI